jgi:hypothetical protein
MTINEHIGHIQILFNSGVPSDDKKLSDEHIYHLMKIVRSRLLYEKQNKMYKLSERSYQYIPCLKLEEGVLNDCPCYNDDCTVLFSCELPSILNWRNNIFLHVTTIDGETIPQTTLKKSNYSKYKKVQLNKHSWFIHNNRLVVLGDIRLCVVSLRGIFEDPLALEHISLCNTEGEDLNVPCYDPMSDNFPMEPELIDVMYKLIVEELKMLYSLPQDNENNAKSVEAVQGKE